MTTGNKLLIIGFVSLGSGLVCGIAWLFYAKNPMDGFGFIVTSTLVIAGRGLILLGAVGGRLR